MNLKANAGCAKGNRVSVWARRKATFGGGPPTESAHRSIIIVVFTETNQE